MARGNENSYAGVQALRRPTAVEDHGRWVGDAQAIRIALTVRLAAQMATAEHGDRAAAVEIGVLPTGEGVALLTSAQGDRVSYEIIEGSADYGVVAEAGRAAVRSLSDLGWRVDDRKLEPDQLLLAMQDAHDG